jgi:hypothetical protein
MKWNKIKDGMPKVSRDVFIVAESIYNSEIKELRQAKYWSGWRDYNHFDLDDQSDTANDIEEQISYKITHWMYCEDFPFPDNKE